MKKLILSVLTMAMLSFAAHAVTYVCVKKSDGQIDKYDISGVEDIDFEDETDSTADNGVTVSGNEGLYSYVDLGFKSGTKWATCNVGASKPTEYGDYFAWGDTKPKDDYGCNSYLYTTDGGKSFTQYDKAGDNLLVLLAADDAATANWGSAWRMPTKAEQKELLDGCDWKWVADFNGSGVNGRLGTSKYNGATIFLPAAGFRQETILGYAGIYGLYWSSSLYVVDSNSANNIYFDGGNIDWNYYNRCSGLSVRAVLK